MSMRVVLEALCPGVQDDEETDPGAQPFGVGSHLSERLGYRAKQDSVNDPRVLECQRSQFVGQRKDHMAIRDRQDFRSPIAQPFVTCPAMALWAMAVAARSVGNLLMAAVITLLHLSAERGSTARADISECLELLARQYLSPAI